MPVRIRCGSHEASPIRSKLTRDDTKILALAGILKGDKPVKLIQSSFQRETVPPLIQAERHGLVLALVEAYNHHHHLHIRPDDIWCAVLAQLSVYVNAHADEVRDTLVTHDGQRKLLIVYNDVPNRFKVDYTDFVDQIVLRMKESLRDTTLAQWVLPDFSTTTASDKAVASTLMMATMQQYFNYELETLCGIPTVTLLGEKQDYERLVERLDRLEAFGEEPTLFARLLRPIFTRMVRSFDEPGDASIKNFWNTAIDICEGGSGSLVYSGWVTAFCFWNSEGECLYDGEKSSSNETTFSFSKHDQLSALKLAMDSIKYSSIDSNQVPAGWATAPVTIYDGPKTIEAEMVAGLVGIRCSSSGGPVEESWQQQHEGQKRRRREVLDTMHPQMGWWIYEKSSRPTE